MSEGGYEFTPQQNDTIEKLGRSMQTVGNVMFLLGILGIIDFIASFWTRGGPGFGAGNGGVGAILFAVFGFWTQRAGNNLKKIVKTTGNDITHLIAALDDLRKMYGIVRFVLLAVFYLALAFVIFTVAAEILGRVHK
jgi:hypothetical protein